MYKNLSLTAFIGIIAIILGAFGAHALKEDLSADEMLSFQTAVRYQIYHVLALLFVNTFTGFTAKKKQVISGLFFVGILFFSGSIYALYLLKIPSKYIWFITPLGGIFFVIGWAFLLLFFVKKSTKQFEK